MDSGGDGAVGWWRDDKVIGGGMRWATATEALLLVLVLVLVLDLRPTG